MKRQLIAALTLSAAGTMCIADEGVKQQQFAQVAAPSAQLEEKLLPAAALDQHAEMVAQQQMDDVAERMNEAISRDMEEKLNERFVSLDF